MQYGQERTSHLLEPSTKVTWTFMDLLVSTDAISPTEGTCMNPSFSSCPQQSCMYLSEGHQSSVLTADMPLTIFTRSSAQETTYIDASSGLGVLLQRRPCPLGQDRDGGWPLLCGVGR